MGRSYSFVTEIFLSGEESYFAVWYVLSILGYEKLCPILLLVVFVLIYCFYCLFLFYLFMNGSFYRLCCSSTVRFVLFIFI